MGLPLAALTVLAALAAPQRRPEEAHPDVPQGRVEEAIRKGVEFLKVAPSYPGEKGVKDSDELILLTLVHGGVPEEDPKVQLLLKNVLEKPLERTYSVSLLAMCLEGLDRVRYQPKIYQSAQFLIDNMFENGRWSYGTPSEAANAVPLPAKGVATKATATPGKPAKPAAPKRLAVRRSKSAGPGGGDNSNSQYAALGLRACHEAGILFPKQDVEKARQAWIETQHPAEGAEGPRRVVGGKPTPSVAAFGVPRGWCYHKGGGKCELGGPAYASMTAGAAGAICIYDHLLGRPWKADPAVADGLAWLDRHWTVSENPPAPETGGPGKGAATWHLYGLYALERLGMLYYTTQIGSHDWYKEGALYLLENQGGNGSWRLSHSMNPTWDTCFAVLFLKRATRPMVASTDRFSQK